MALPPSFPRCPLRLPLPREAVCASSSRCAVLCLTGGPRGVWELRLRIRPFVPSGPRPLSVLRLCSVWPRPSAHPRMGSCGIRVHRVWQLMSAAMAVSTGHFFPAGRFSKPFAHVPQDSWAPREGSREIPFDRGGTERVSARPRSHSELVRALGCPGRGAPFAPSRRSCRAEPS